MKDLDFIFLIILEINRRWNYFKSNLKYIYIFVHKNINCGRKTEKIFNMLFLSRKFKNKYINFKSLI